MEQAPQLTDVISLLEFKTVFRNTSNGENAIALDSIVRPYVSSKLCNL